MNAIIDGWKCWASHSFSLSQLPHLQNRMVLLPLLISQSCSKIQRKHAEENPLQGHDYCHNHFVLCALCHAGHSILIILVTPQKVLRDGIIIHSTDKKTESERG